MKPRHIATYLRSDMPDEAALMAILDALPPQRRSGFVRACVLMAVAQARIEPSWTQEIALRADIHPSVLAQLVADLWRPGHGAPLDDDEEVTP